MMAAISCCVASEQDLPPKSFIRLQNPQKLGKEQRINPSDANYAAILALLGIDNITAFDTPEYIFLAAVVVLWVAFDVYDKYQKAKFDNSQR